MPKPLILVTNDDGITAGGIRKLVDIAREFGDVLIVAPDSPQSAQGHAITIETPVFVRESKVFGEQIEAYECSGTPVDCVKLAKSVLLNGRTPDLCVSGINHGSNAAVNIIYSGTLSAAMEASLEGVPSVGFSYLHYAADADFTVCEPYVRKIISHVLDQGMAEGSLYNVNIPHLPAAEIKGIKVCRQANARWVEEYAAGEDPRGPPLLLAHRQVHQRRRAGRRRRQCPASRLRQPRTEQSRPDELPGPGRTERHRTRISNRGLRRKRRTHYRAKPGTILIQSSNTQSSIYPTIRTFAAKRITNEQTPMPGVRRGIHRPQRQKVLLFPLPGSPPQSKERRGQRLPTQREQHPKAQ